MTPEIPDETMVTFDADDLVARCMGNIEFAQRIITKFRNNCEEDLAELERALDARETETVAAVAHRLKGASANASVPRLQAKAAVVEEAARARAWEKLPGDMESLRHEWCRFASEDSPLVAALDPTP